MLDTRYPVPDSGKILSDKYQATSVQYHHTTIKNMLLQSKLGNLTERNPGKAIDWLQLQWYETGKRILRKHTVSGKEVSIRFLDEHPQLTEGDILWEEEQFVIAVSIVSCECMVVQPANMFEMASVCYEIGNKHLPLFYEADSLLVPFDAPLMRLLAAQGYSVTKDRRKLLQPLKTTVLPHRDGSNSLFSKIMKLTNPAS